MAEKPHLQVRLKVNRNRLAELNEDLRRVEAGLEALAGDALALAEALEPKVQLVRALTDFGVRKSFQDHGVPQATAPSTSSATAPSI